MTKEQAIVKIVELLESYYGVKYRDAVRHDLMAYLSDMNQDWAVGLFEQVKLRHPTQFKEPPCVSVFHAVSNKYEDEIRNALRGGGQGIKMKALLEPVVKRIKKDETPVTVPSKEEFEKIIAKLKAKFQGRADA